jgi:hypothetical protein
VRLQGHDAGCPDWSIVHQIDGVVTEECGAELPHEIYFLSSLMSSS